jgi:hypothetical protein
MKISKEEKSKLGGKIMMVVEAFTQRPVTLWWEHQCWNEHKYL